MLVKDIKILWGRSGNRCAICKIELTPDGEVETIGEIAHIVSRTQQGPRGDDILPLSKRDEYSNLILLCPNHHTEIDKFPQSWPSLKIHQTKEDHEKCVSDQLKLGVLSYKPIDNSVFIESIQNYWNSFSDKKFWVIASVTPLSVNDDSIDPLDDNVINTLNSVKLPDADNFWVSDLNKYDTRPDANGITNIKLKNIKDGDGHKISIYRNGHCEFLFCLESSVNTITQYAAKQETDRIGHSRVIRYTHLAEVVKKQIEALQKIWSICLQFKNMTLTISILNTRNAILFSREKDPRGALYGYPVNADNLCYSIIIDKNFPANDFIEIILKRLVNYFGLVLLKMYNEKGEFVRPEKL